MGSNVSRATVVVVSLVAAACGSSGSAGPVVTTCDGVEVVVAGSDYTSESIVCGGPPCARGPGTSGVFLGKDPQLTEGNGRTFFLARDTDYVFELDARCGNATKQIEVGELARSVGRVGSNVHDIAAAPDGSLWAVSFSLPQLFILRDGNVEGTIDLRPYDDDGSPEAESIRIVDVGGVWKAFVTLERLTFYPASRTFRSERPSTMLRIDVATRRVEAVVTLEGRNPFNPMRQDEGMLYLAEPGNFDAADEPAAGIERFDTTTSTTKLLVKETDLGGSVAEIAVAGSCGAAIVAGPAENVNPTTLVLFDATTGAVLSRPFGPTPGYDLQGLAWRGRALYVGDRRAGGGGYPVHVFERAAEGCALANTGRTIDVPLAPVALRSAGAAR